MTEASSWASENCSLEQAEDCHLPKHPQATVGHAVQCILQVTKTQILKTFRLCFQPSGPVLYHVLYQYKLKALLFISQ